MRKDGIGWASERIKESIKLVFSALIVDIVLYLILVLLDHHYKRIINNQAYEI